MTNKEFAGINSFRKFSSKTSGTESNTINCHPERLAWRSLELKDRPSNSKISNDYKLNLGGTDDFFRINIK